MAKTNKTEAAVLGALSFEPMSGYDIKKALDRTVSHFWNENFGQLYPVLKRLEAERLISRDEGGSPGAVRRNVYRLTKAGARALDTWLSSEPGPQLPRNELLLQLFFSGAKAPSLLRTKIRGERERQQKRQRALLELETSLQAAAQTDPAALGWVMTLGYGLRISEAVLEWCDDCEKKLDALENA